jgi:exodeoxyribonuclease-1
MNKKSLFFYDLETSGFDKKEARIMQFAGRRTSMDLEVQGEPFNFLIKLSEDTLPDPGAIFVTGITPQKTLEDGITEAEFMKIFHEQISVPGTIFTGFNSVRFDDEFMRFLNYRNFYDAYEWEWKDGRGRWDLLDVVRMTRALRPAGIVWPNDSEGKPTNKLELLAKENNLIHTAAHDALSDVEALIGLAQLIRSSNAKLFDYLLSVMTDKNKIEEIVKSGEPFIYTSGKYDGKYEKTTAVASVLAHPTRKAALVFDLRYSPDDYSKLSVEEILEHWKYSAEDEIKIPIKTLQFNRCPAIAPLGVLDEASQKRLSLSMKTVEGNFRKLQAIRPDFGEKILKAVNILDEKQDERSKEMVSSVDGQLYDNFINPSDKIKMHIITSANPTEIGELQPGFKDVRLQGLLPLYKARNFPKILTDEDRKIWDEHRTKRLVGDGENSRLKKYFNELNELSQKSKLSKNQRYLLEELQLWGQSIVPNDYFD